MLRRFALFTGVVITTFSCLWATTAAARTEEWNDAQGNRFRGQPAEVLGHVRRVQNGHLVAADLKGRPEPEFLIVFFASSGEGKSWEMMGNKTSQRYAKLQADYPGMVEALFFGLRHKRYEHEAMATGMNMSWLVADLLDEDGMNSILHWAPRDGFGLIVLTRDGAALFSSGGEDQKAIGRVFDDLAGVLALLRPDNPLSWKDRAYYLQAIGRALLQTVFVPAVENGKSVEGVYEYQFGAPR